MGIRNDLHVHVDFRRVKPTAVIHGFYQVQGATRKDLGCHKVRSQGLQVKQFGSLARPLLSQDVFTVCSPVYTYADAKDLVAGPQR